MPNDIEHHTVEYSADGRDLIGDLYLPDATNPRPSVLVFHEGPGLDGHARGRAERLARLGHPTFAADYHGDGQRLDLADVMPRLGQLMTDPDRTRALARAAYEQLAGHPRVDASRIAAIGYCFGGTMALELARGGAALSAVVGFHSGLATQRPQDAANIRCPILVCIGADDPLIPPEQRDAFMAEMRAADVDWRMNLYGGAVHSFTNPDAGRLGRPGIAYHEPTDIRSWQAMLDFFAEAFSRDL